MDNAIIRHIVDINTKSSKKSAADKVFLNATMSGDPTLPGVGPDLVYRDPWGNPYIITMDLNYDEQVQGRVLLFGQSVRQ